MLAGWVAGQLDHLLMPVSRSVSIALLQASMLCMRHAWCSACTGRGIYVFPPIRRVTRHVLCLLLLQPTMAMIALKCPEIEVVVLDINEGRVSLNNQATKASRAAATCTTPVCTAAVDRLARCPRR
jgi:hypothetical protein